VSSPLLQWTPGGIRCEEGDFTIDPMRRVDRAIVTHGHSDHARRGMGSYLCAKSSVPILMARLGSDIRVTGLEFGEAVTLNGVRVSLHPAGHIPGSAQVRVERGGEVWVVTGDYKTESDGSSEAFELVPCHTLITETTFALPIYRWSPQKAIFAEISEWREECRQNGITPILTGYSLGKAQRLLAGVAKDSGPVIVHPTIATMNRACMAGGAKLPPFLLPSEKPTGLPWSECLVILSPGEDAPGWLSRIGRASRAYASGWMAASRGQRGGANDRGFVLSDHVDWPSLNQVVRECGAERVYTTHGYEEQAARWFRELGLDSEPWGPPGKGEE
jgi:putative mRNA 3-end processing factor